MTLTLPASVVEGRGILTNAGNLLLGGMASSNVVVTLDSSDSASLVVPTNVTVGAGQSNVLFSLLAPDDTAFNGTRTVAITATAAGFGLATNVVNVFDNDVYRFRFSPIGWLQTTNADFGVMLYAEDPAGRLMSNYTGSATLMASGIEGVLPVEPTNTGAFNGGQRFVGVRVTAPGTAVRLRALEASGESDAFNVEPPPFQILSQRTVDIAWHEQSGILFASVPPDGGAYSNMLVAIDPFTRTVTNAYPLGSDPQQIELAPNGGFLYAAISNRNALRRFDLVTRQPGLTVATGSSLGYAHSVVDLTVLSGASDAVVVTLGDLAGNSRGVWRYNSGIAQELGQFSLVYPYTLEASAVGGVLYGYQFNNSYPLARGVAVSGAAIVVTNNLFRGGAMVLRQDVLYDNAGRAVKADSFALLGDYPGALHRLGASPLVEVDPLLRRTFFLSRFDNGWEQDNRLEVYDRDLFVPLCEVRLPVMQGGPMRLLRWGTNGLVFNTGGGEIWFARSGLFVATHPAVDLRMTQSLPSLPVVLGSNTSFTLTLSNAGPGTASLVRVTNNLPVQATVVSTTASTGSVVLAGSAFSWNLAALPAGASATLDVTIRFGNAGWHTNLVRAIGFELDPIWTNNISRLPFEVQFPPDALGTFPINIATEDVLYDPARDRLLLSIGSGSGNQTNGIAILNPYNGLVESFVGLGRRPGDMERTADGQYLYVSLPADGLVRRLNLNNFSQNLEFAVGTHPGAGMGEIYPLYAREIAALAEHPESVAIVRTSIPTGGNWGLGLYENGILRSNITAPGNSWTIEFNTNDGTLFGYDTRDYVSGSARDIYRFGISAAGIENLEGYPRLSFGAGSDIEYAAGRFFTTAGRVLLTQPFGVTGIYPMSESATLVEPDADSDRVFYLTASGTSGILRAYEMNDPALLGSVTISNLFGTPTSLIRWGTNGLAFRTTGDQLFIVRTPLVQPSAAADLRVKLEGPSVPVPVGSNATFTVTLTNQGPAIASDVQITNQFTPAALLTSANSSSGSFFTNGAGLVWTLPGLVPGGQETLSFSLQSGQTGVVTILSSAFSGTPDPAPQDNTALSALAVGPPGSDRPILINLPTRDMVWSPSLKRLLLTSSTNLPNGDGLLLSLDPETLDLRWEVPLGPGAARLCLAGDDSRLYTALTYGVEERSLPSFAFQRRFLLGELGALERAADLEVLPGIPSALGVLRVDSFNAANVGVWDNGVSRTSLALSQNDSASEVLEVGNDPARLYVQNFGSGGFRRYTVNDQGTTFVDADTTLLPTGTAMEIEWGNGRIYSSMGRVIDPENRKQLGTIPGIPTGSLVRYDDASARVFYLTPGLNSAALRAFDGPTLLPVGGATFSGVRGSPASFVRWGADGFAFTTSSNQLWLFRTRLVPTNPPADIAVTLTHEAPPHIAGSNLTATILITNAGPNDARNVTWTNALPPGSVVLDAAASQGSINFLANIVSGEIATLTTGIVASVTVTFRVLTAGVTTNQIAVISSSVDPAFANNLATALLWVQPPTGLPSTVSLGLPVKDLERDPVRPLLYASFGSGAGPLADSIVTIDPANGSFGAPVRVGSDPGRLAASPDGQFLYVGLDGAGTVQKLSLPNLTPVSSFAVAQNQRVLNMVVSPTDPDTVALRRTPGGRTGLYVNGVQRPGELADQDLFAFSETSGFLFGCNGNFSNVKLYRLDAGPTGLRLLDGQPGKQSSATDLKSSGGMLFFNRGMVVEPDATRVRAVMPVPVNSVVEPDAALGRVFYLTPAGSAWTLRAFDIAQGIEIGAVPVPGLGSAPRRLLRWGSDGLALYTTNSQVIILRGVLVPTNPPVDVVLRQSVSVLEATTNDTLNISLQLTNSGPVTASGVVVTQIFSSLLTNVTLTAGTGTATYTNGTVGWQIGNLTTGAVVSLNVALRALQPGTLTVAAAAYHDLNDPFWGNNTALNAVNIVNPAASNVVQLRLATREIIYDPARDVIYASTPATNRLSGNLIAVINPVTGAMERSLPAGSEPNQVALSDDARYLYVSLDGAMGVQRFDLQAGTADLSFQFGTNDLFYAQDLEVQPGHPQTAAASLGSFNFSAGFPSSVFFYEAGIRLTNGGGPSRGLTFSSDGSYVFGYISPGSGSGFVRMKPGNNGISITESLPGFSSIPGDLKFSNGRLYSYSGQVIDPYVPISIGTFSASGPQTVDTAAGRVFYLAQSGANWNLRAFDVGTFQNVGTQLVSNVRGTPSNLIRCGADRLAFRTSSNQVFIVRSPLVPTNLVAADNLAVTQSASQDFASSAETLRFEITVTNRGSGTASNVLLAIKPPSPVESVALQLPQGSSTNSGGNYLCNLGSLADGQSFKVVLSAVITNTGTYTNLASVSAATPDPDSLDNVSLATQSGLFFQRADSVRRFALTVRDLAYDRFSRRLFATVVESDNNRLVWFDPETALLTGSIPMSLVPDRMAISDDGQFLYVTGVNTSRVERVHLPSNLVDFSFDLPVSYTVQDLLVLPGQPHALVVAQAIYGGAIAAVYDDGVSRTNQQGNWFKLMVASEDGSSIFGYDNSSTGGASPDVFRMAVNGNGIEVVDTGPSDMPGGNVDMQYSGGRLYFGNGEVMNPTGWVMETSFPRLDNYQLVEINAAASRAILLGVPWEPYYAGQLGVFDLSTRQQLQLLSVPGVNVYSGVGSFTQCDADRLAVRSDNAVVFVRSSAIPTADLLLQGMLSSNLFYAADTVTITITASNAGVQTVTSVLLTNALPPETRLLGASLSQGILATNADGLVASFGTLSNGSSAVLILQLQPTNTAARLMTNVADVSASELPDPFPANNHLSQIFMVVADADRDGLPDNWELAHGLNPTNALDAVMDSDCDGSSNLQEFQAGTDPFHFENVRLTSPQLDAQEWFELTVHGQAGKTYTLESSTNLTQWWPVSTFICRSSNQKIQTPVTQAGNRSFYRLQTDTNAPLPLLDLVNGPALATNSPLLLITAPPGRNYSIQTSTNLIDWAAITNFYGLGCATVIPDTTSTGHNIRFYRVMVQ